MNCGFSIVTTRSMQWFCNSVTQQLRTFPDYYDRNFQTGVSGRMQTRTFADGEMEVEILTSLRGKQVFLLASCARNAAGIPLNEAKVELYHAVDAIRRSAAQRIILIEPYMTCSRSDRTTRRNSVGFWVHYKTLASLGINHIITYQLHSDKSKTAVDPTRVLIDDVPVTGLLMEYIARTSTDLLGSSSAQGVKNWAFCSVDAGGEGLARQYAKAFGADLIIAHKKRNYNRANSIESIKVLSDTSLQNKTIWIVDDMIDTGGSLYALVKELRNRGVGSVHVAVVHPVFSQPAVERLAELSEAGFIDRMVVVETVEITPEIKKKLNRLEIVSPSRLTAEIILRVYDQDSLSPFFEEPNLGNLLNGKGTYNLNL
ncbi:ribose-phosphate diphosphokinase [Spirochaeta lutea]|uniref:ribose-phosphate diphosphokinase n=1 Tax=Spirochaeta lutea TaxID=1480694 RepID=A0A098R1R5_9SPIO|nr:ribose-phosphate diphosphokinase [Spirochaeta lutea]KGE73909.1 ribose-phosphate pyrophosphokinase [Spirochaeta lutea]